MTLKLNPTLIDDFRNIVNRNSIFRSTYKNVDGKNKWNIICSAMDWTNVTAEGISHIKLGTKRSFGVNHLNSLNLMQYIVTLDVLVESIIQLYRVLDPDNPYPLLEDRSVFEQSSISDDKYFKHIRAVFGTHPVNLDSLDGFTKRKGERFYASWSAKGTIDDFDYIVYLYSNDPGRDEINHFGIRIDEVNEYAEKRYLLLMNLKNIVQSFLDKHEAKLKTSPIILVDNILEQLEILIHENNRRYGNKEGYFEDLVYLQNMIKLDLSQDHEEIKEIVSRYKNFLIEVTSKYKKALETLDDSMIESWSMNVHGYEYEKIYSFLIDGNHPLGRSYFQKLMENNTLPYYLIDSSFQEKQLVMESVIYCLAVKKKDKITYKELLESAFFKRLEEDPNFL